MSEEPTDEPTSSPEAEEVQGRRLFLLGMGKWSGAAIAAAVAGGCVAVGPVVPVGGWINGGGSWINRRGNWVNRGGSWVNRAGGGGWANRAGGGGWVNRRGGGGSWINRR
jgi:hypothetical protein